MTLFSRISKDCQNSFTINFIFPKIKKIDEYNILADHYQGIKILFDTSLILLYCEGYWHVQASLLGFGIIINRQKSF